MARPQKTLRLKYSKPKEGTGAHVTVLGNPSEVRVAGSDNCFIGVRENGITLAGGSPSVINIQGLSSSMRYAGMLSDLPFPLSLMPTTMATPFPKQMVTPPFMDMIPIISELSLAAAAMVI